MDIKKALLETVSTYKKPLIICGIFIGILIIFFVVVSIVRGLKLSYDEIELKMKQAAISYYDKYKEKLPKSEGGEVIVKDQTLSDNELMKPIEKYIRNDEISCDGEVIVTRTYNNYLYTPVLDCGEEYKTEKLVDKITETKNIVEAGNGLYKNGDGYYYRGEYVNNYIKIGDNLWRVLSVKEDGTIRIIQDKLQKNLLYVYDDRYNNESEDKSGFNLFEKSRLKDSMLQLYKSDKILNSEQKAIILSDQLCIGSRSFEDTNNDGSVECSNKTSKKYPFGLIQINEFIRASLDNTCQKINDKSCSNYNYLIYDEYDYWTITPSNDRSYYNYVLSNEIYETNTSSEKRVRIVVNISKNVTFSSGKGTVKKPYIVNY